MTLPERCRNVRAQIDERNKIRVAHQEADAFRVQLNDLRPVRLEIASELAKLMVFKKRAILVNKPPAPTTAQNILTECKTGLENNPNEIGRDFGLLKRSLNKVRNDVVKARDKALEAVSRALPNIEESYLKQVELIPTYKTRVEQIRLERDRLQQGTNPSSLTAQQLEHFLDSRDSLRQRAEALKPEEFPKEVLEFFSAARRGGIPLEKFSSSLEEWLSQRDQLKNVRVTILN
jgi:hypothetical protein